MFDSVRKLGDAIYVTTMAGIGDTCYIRPFIKILARDYDVYIKTVLPKMYSDITGVKFIRDEKETFRTQQKSRLDDDTIYSTLPEKYHEINAYYVGKDLVEGGIVPYMYKVFDIPFHEKLDWSLPDFFKEFDNNPNSILIPKNRKLAIVRPATIRKEWEVTSRNPDPNYLAWCAKALHESGYFVISIADLKEGEEWLAKGVDIEYADLKLHSGELGLFGTMHLISIADIVVGGVGFVTPITISTNTPLFTIFGGRQIYDCVKNIFHPSMPLDRCGWSIPDNPCKCSLMMHNCDKKITHIESDFYKFLGSI